MRANILADAVSRLPYTWEKIEIPFYLEEPPLPVEGLFHEGREHRFDALRHGLKRAGPGPQGPSRYRAVLSFCCRSRINAA